MIRRRDTIIDAKAPKPEVARVRTGNAMTRTCSLRRRRTVGPIASKLVEKVGEDVDSTVEKFGRDPPRRN